MRRPRRFDRRSDRGAAAVEMALLLPVLLLVVFGTIDFGFLLNAQITLTEAAREGARAEAVGAEAGARVRSASQNLTGEAVRTTVSSACPETPGATDDAVVITNYTYKFITPVGALAGLFGKGFDGSVALSGRGVMPCMH